MPVTGQEATDYLRWRGLLVRARQTVRHRLEVIDGGCRTLTGAAPTKIEWTNDGLIRLLAAEQQSAAAAAAVLPDAADLLSQVCAQSFAQATAPLWLRVQSLMVMSAAVPQHMVALLPGLLAVAGHEPVLIDQMLLDCCRLLLRARATRPLMSCNSGMPCWTAATTWRTSDPSPAPRRPGPSGCHPEPADHRDLPEPEQAAHSAGGVGTVREDLVRPVERHRLEAWLLLSAASWRTPNGSSRPLKEPGGGSGLGELRSPAEERALASLSRCGNPGGDFVADWLGGGTSGGC